MTPKTVSLTELNTADEEVLVRKLKISSRLAKRMMGLRPYQSLEEIDKVWGIDTATLQRIKALVGESESEVDSDSEAGDLSDSSPVEEADSQVKADDLLQPAQLEQAEKPNWKINLLLLLIFAFGAYFRFTGLNWDDGQHQHPDERYISMVSGQIDDVGSLEEYFDTWNSPLNPLSFGSYTYGMFPLFFTHWVANWVGMSDYDSITLTGRAMSGVFDLLAVWMLYVLGKRLYDKRIGLIAAALGVAAVLPIQLSHYFTVDSFSTVFILAGFYFAIRAVPLHVPDGKIFWSNLSHFILFGFFIGLAGACKVNTLPVLAIIVLAGIARLITAWKKENFSHDLKIIFLGWVFSVAAAFFAFRVFQPYAFTGPGFWGLDLNENWLRVMKEVIDQVAGNSDWPPNTHWTDRAFSYAWSNMVFWGMGIPLGLAGWLGWAWAVKRIWNGDWSRHLLPLVWVAGYFIWQNMQFWRYMRYFLPIYPFIILFAAWALVEIYDQTRESRERLFADGFKSIFRVSDWRFTWKGLIGILIPALVMVGTYGYALAFTRIYNRPMTRIAASEWMLENIAAPFNVVVDSPSGSRSYPVAVSNRQVIEPGLSASSNITVLQYGTVSRITSTDIRQVGVNFYFKLTRDQEGNDIITDGRLVVNDNDSNSRQEISFGDIDLEPGGIYYFHYRIRSSSQFSFSNPILKNADDSMPSLPVELNLQSQSGLLEGSLPLMPQESLSLNRLQVNDFQQSFIPTETTLKLGIYKEGDSEHPLMETSQVLAFTAPGQRIAPTFTFAPVELYGEQTYQVRYEVTAGAPLRVFGDSFTLETSWDDALPLNINKYDAQGGIFTPLNLELYEPDTPEKREAMIRVLEQSNYIVIPSNRAYDAMPRMPMRYPLTLKYYQALFDCECSGDDLENRAYGLRPPFKSPLGFELIAVFESPPSLGFLTFPDQAADESFTVYDHPKVMVFKKSQDFSSAHVAALLNEADLSEVFFQTPLEYTKAPTAMKLPSDRLQAQRDGGSWSFDRSSFLNVNQVAGGLVWYFFLFLLGLAIFPTAGVVFDWLPDRGYPLMRMAGLLVTTWMVWMLGSFKVLPFSQWTIWLCIGLLLVVSAALAYRRRALLLEYFSTQWKHILWTELIFLLVFLAGLFIRLGNPDLWHPWLGGEKPMDFTFFNAVLRTVYFPPEHPWFAGRYINYYYYGYIIAAIPTKLLGILPSIAYNLILPSWFAMTGIGMFSIGFNLMAGLRETPPEAESQPAAGARLLGTVFARQNLLKSLPYLTGVLALVLVLFLGNLYEVPILWRYMPEATVDGAEAVTNPVEHVGAFIGGTIRILTGQTSLPGNNGRWYFEASRPILARGPDTPIAEFPYFTFLYGDMHPHLLVMPIYALVFGWVLNLLLWKPSRIQWTSRIPGLIAAGFIFGVFRASHTWDFPTFVGLGALAILWNVWRSESDSAKRVIQSAFVYELFFVGIAAVFYQPFAQWFKTEYASLEIWKGATTPLIDYLWVFGLALFAMTTLLIRDLYPIAKAGGLAWFDSIRKRLLNFLSASYLKWYLVILIFPYLVVGLWLFGYPTLAFGVPLLLAIGYLLFAKRSLTALEQVMWVLFALGLAITLFVEVFVLKGDSGRSNTVFRFYNQAWFIFGLATSLALVNLLAGMRAWSYSFKYAWGFSLGVIILFAASYPLIATNKKITDRWTDIQNPPHTLDGAAFMLGDVDTLNPAIYNDENRLLNLGNDYAAIQFMQDHVAGSPVIVEGHTEEYRWGSRFAIHTGLPSVVGWSWHVRQHNSLLDGAIVDRLIDEVNTFYNTDDIQIARQFLDKHQVRYVVVGDLERAYYDPNGFAKLQQMTEQGVLRIVFGDNTAATTTIFEVVETR